MSDAMIQTICDYFATQPVLRAWVFGSYARGEETPESDVDIL
ncbi:MAG: nucleotidyltransferase domain-containing protein, partial [Bacteroidales bacterium]|nr:nucleotidyltransferase domain-containing protein [Bacteroidales bacterium]